MRKIFALIAAAVGVVATSSAGQVTLTFDLSELGLPNGPCGALCPSANGLTVQGVTFGFTGSANALYGSSFGLPSQNLQDPVLSGPADGTLTLTFLTPTPTLQFDVALAVISSETPGFSVQLTPGSSTPVNTLPLALVSEGVFSYDNPGVPITQAIVTFSQNDGNSAFALDNLAFDPPSESSPAPEPQPAALLGSGLLLLGMLTFLRRRHHAGLDR
jgi:MYXO-CTERM domain-containing protein